MESISEDTEDGDAPLRILPTFDSEDDVDDLTNLTMSTPKEPVPGAPPGWMSSNHNSGVYGPTGVRGDDEFDTLYEDLNEKAAGLPKTPEVYGPTAGDDG